MAFPVNPSTGDIYNRYIFNGDSWREFESYPVGSIYINASDGTNPSILLGFGTWEKINGRTLKDEGVNYSIGLQSGKLRHKHISPAARGGNTGDNGMRTPAHEDGSVVWPYGTTSEITAGAKKDEVNKVDTTNEWFYNSDESTEQPYTVVYMWKRIA